MEGKYEENLGLTAKEALSVLYRDVKRALGEHEVKYRKRRKYRLWLRDALHHRSRYTTFCWTTAACLLVIAAALIYAFYTENYGVIHYLPFEGLVIVFLVIANLTLVILDNKFRHQEIPFKIECLLKKIQAAQETCKWEPENFPHLCSPLSPCLTLQWTYRDGHLINLPWALLVAGDVVVIKPGQHAPGYCVPYEDNDGPTLRSREIFAPQTHLTGDSFYTMPQTRVPLKNKIYKLQETPYVVNLRLALDQSLGRPVTYHNQERHLLMIRCLEQLTFPILTIVVIGCNLAHYFYLNDIVGTGPWIDMFLLQPIAVVLPLMPVTFPIWWLVLNCFGMARFKALFKLSQVSNKTQCSDPFEDVSDPNHMEVKYNWKELLINFLKIITGTEKMMSRSANIVHVLGSVTALCCVDKKGILSWPNPTAEKVFFLRNANSKNNPNFNTVSQASSDNSLNKSAEPLFHPDSTKQDSNRTSYRSTVELQKS